MRRCERRCEEEQMWEKMWRWADVKMSRCERRCEDEQMWRGADVKMSRCEDEQMWRWADVKMSRCEDEQMWEKIWRWTDVKMSRCGRRCEDDQMWRWADVREDLKMSRCEDEKMWRCEDVKMSRCEDEQMWRWEGVKMRRCEDEKVWQKVWCDRRCEDEKVWRWEDEIQTPTIGRTLRSDALGNKTLTFSSLLTWCTIPCACHAKRHLNVQKWSEPLVFWTFWLRNVPRATTACTFSTSQLLKVLRCWSVFSFFHLQMCFAPQRRALFHLSSDQLAPHPPL